MLTSINSFWPLENLRKVGELHLTSEQYGSQIVNPQSNFYFEDSYRTFRTELRTWQTPFTLVFADDDQTDSKRNSWHWLITVVRVNMRTMKGFLTYLLFKTFLFIYSYFNYPV